MNFKNIHIGKLIKQKVVEEQIENERILKHFKVDEVVIEKCMNLQA